MSCMGKASHEVRVLSSNALFDFGHVSRMWVDNSEVMPSRELVFGDTIEHEIRIQFDTTNKLPDYTFFDCDALISVTIEDSVKEIGECVFQGAVNVSCMVVFGDSLPNANHKAFGDSSDPDSMCCSRFGPDVSRIYASAGVLKTISDDWEDLEKYATFKPLLEEHPYSVASNRTVLFGSSNLQYIADHDVFTFGKWQGAYMGAGGGNETAPASRGNSGLPIDLFGWGCSGGDYAGYRRHWKPYDCVYYSSGSSFAYYYGIVYGSSNYSYNIAATGADWGVANRMISERVRTGWRTLTADEWVYLFSGRKNASALRAKCNIDGTKGLILLPDDWSLPDGANLVTDVLSSTTYASNTMTRDDWDVLENAGAVFLPATGYRSGVTASSSTTTADDYSGSAKPSVGDGDHSGNPTGSYWSTTYSGSSAYRFYFANGNTTAKSAGDRYKGYAVRLVRDNN